MHHPNVVKFAHSLIFMGVLAVAFGPAASAGQPVLELQLVTSQLDRPVVITHAGDGSGRLFIAEQDGEIRIVDADGNLLALPFLDISAQTSCCSERGLLGIAFHPDFETNGFFFVHYSDSAGDTMISRFSVSAGNPNLADIASEVELLAVSQPYPNHNGGQIEFGPDGYLYIGLGDGGSGGDPEDRAQNLGLLLGKILRIDIDNQDPGLEYAIPPSNPFVGVSGVAEEIWAYGLRNPWRFSFDRQTGDLFIGDVGQNLWEEIDFQPVSSPGGENWGWRCYEGDAVYNSTGCGPAEDYEFPILTYHHDFGCSVSGGYRYRGARYSNLFGLYVYGDYCSGRIWGATNAGGPGWSATELLDVSFFISTFGENEDGELFVAALSSFPNGAVYRIVDTHVFSDGFDTGDTASWADTVP